MSISITNNVVSGPEERPIPAHLSFGQFMFDQLKTGGDNVALVSILFTYLTNLNTYINKTLQKIPRNLLILKGKS